MATRLQVGKETALFFKKPSGSTFIALGCLTDYEFSEPGKTTSKVSCRAGSFAAPTGDKELGSLSVNGINRIYTGADIAANVSKEEIRGWAQNGDILEVKWGGTIVGDPVHTGKAIVNDFSDKAPNDTNGTFSFKLTLTEEYTTAALA